MQKARVYLVLIIIIFSCSYIYGQVLISKGQTSPAPSAMLEIKSNDKGFLLPRMTLEERNDIVDPAEGLMIYCLDCGRNGIPVLSVFMTGSWKNLAGCTPPVSPVEALHFPNSSKINWKWSKVPEATGYRWSHLPDTLEIDLTDTSYLETGLICGTEYSRYVWAYNDCGLSSKITLNASTNYQSPPEPLAAIHVPTLSQITWKWRHLDDATGYKWNTVQVYENAVNIETDTTYLESNLVCDSLYHRYLWAFNNCGISEMTVIQQSTNFDTLPVPIAGTHLPTASQINWNWEQVDGALGYKWNTTNNYLTATNLGNQLTVTEAELDCQTIYTRYLWAYNNCGYSPAGTMTDTTLDIPITAAPDEALHYSSATSILWRWYNLDGAYSYKWNQTNTFTSSIDLGSDTSYTENNLACNTSHTRYVWAYDSCGVSPAGILSFSTRFDSLDVPTAGTHISDTNKITWHWNEVAGAIGYKWSQNNNYEEATVLGNVLSYLDTGLSCGINYTRYVWAYNNCGYSLIPATLNKSTNNCWVCGDSFTVYHVTDTVAPVTKTVTYGTVPNLPGLPDKCWITSNLGADHQASANNDATEASAGWYFQFNREQGFKHDGSIRTPNSSWMTEINESFNWIAANDPCTIELGPGWRVPTAIEWDNVDTEGGWANWLGPWNSALKMHAAGRLDLSNGSLGERGAKGSYWSATQMTLVTWAQSLNFNTSACAINQFQKAYGYSIRCLKD